MSATALPVDSALDSPTIAGTATAPRGRATWSGLLKFSLVAVPVKAHPAAVTSAEIHFNQIHANCGQRIRYEKHCAIHGKVEAGGIVSGYEYVPGQYVIVDDAELEQLRPERDRALALECFLDPYLVDPALFSGRTLYLLPDGPAAHHPYAVLVETLLERHKWAVARVVLSGRRNLTLVRPAGRILAMHVLHFPAQLRPSTTLETELRPDAVSEAEQQLAGQLIEAGTQQPVDWSTYRDDTAEQLAALIEAKVQGRPLEPPKQEEAPVLRLLDALKQSVAEAVKRRPTPEPEAPKGKRRTSRRSA